jgi:hypothetical protein
MIPMIEKMQNMRSTLSWLLTLPQADRDIRCLTTAVQNFVADVEPIVEHLTGTAA